MFFMRRRSVVTSENRHRAGLLFSGAAFAVSLGTFAALGTGCQVRGETAELVLKGSIAESSEVVQLDPVFLSRQKQVEAQFFGFEDPSSPPANALPGAAGHDDEGIDVAIAPPSVADMSSKGPVDLRWPILGHITSPYGMRRGRLHAGIDIKGNKGDPIYAAADGQVLTSKRRNAYGLVAIVGHDHDVQTLYAHMIRLAVREGEFVKAGEVVGYVGRTGRATGYHLHFETRVQGGVPHDPMRYLPANNAKALKVGYAPFLEGDYGFSPLAARDVTY